MSAPIETLLGIMRSLREKDTGCPWDIEQDFRSLAPYAIEEAYEVADAIERGDFDGLKQELGDLLLQVVFHAQMAEERGLFDFDAVAAAISDKMIRRHPHVFDAQGRANAAGGVMPAADADAGVTGAEAQTVAWEAMKKQERERAGDADASALAGITRGLPEWQRALKLQKRAAAVGFDWPDVECVFGKLQEEIGEVRDQLRHGRGHLALEDEIGDILFVCVNLSRHAGVDFGSALRRANAKFERRFRLMETLAGRDGRQLPQLSLAEQESLWNMAKKQEIAYDPL
jgi:nucleoside triphosphate diphosphatase